MVDFLNLMNLESNSYEKNKTYECDIEKDRYRVDLANYNEEVNIQDNNTQVGDPVDLTKKYDKWCVNVSDVILPTYDKDILKLGEKFNFNSGFDDRLALNCVKNFETFVKNYPNKVKISKIRGTFLNVIKKFYNKDLSNYSHFEKKFKIDLAKTKETKFVKRNSDILITREDKGNSTVIIKKSVYNEKLESLFCDHKYYERISSNPLSSVERKTNELIK